MTITVSKPTLNLREELSALKKVTGVKGEELMRANTVSDVYNSINPVMFRNRVHNGDMRIDQRNSGAAIASNAAGDQWPVDRFDLYSSNAGILSMQQNQGSYTPPPGFKNYVGFTTIATGSGSVVPNHLIEGLNTADLDWGLSTAKTCTLSFWVRSSIPGTHGGYITNQPLNRYYVYTYNISQANTWEYKTITIPGDTTGTWNRDNTRGICLFWSFRGTSNHSTFNQWYAPGSTTLGVSGCVDITQTVGATWAITGLQFEQGTVATPFENRPYGTELALCQRYCTTINETTSNGGYIQGYGGGCRGVTYINVSIPLPVTMRSTPSLLNVGGTVRLTVGGTYVDSASGSMTIGGVTPTIAYSANSGNLSLSYIGGPVTGLTGIGNNVCVTFFTNGDGKLFATAEL